MVQRFLFETRLGAWLLGTFERLTGLAVVSADSLGEVQFVLRAGGE